jgi:glutamate synthase (NADPH/NADH) large chain/glutamate synthase (ferredoxin)
VVVLGRTGVNFAAGMSGGFVFVFDKDQLFDTKCNLEMVDIEPVTEKKDITLLKSLIKQHIKYTKSSHALYLLENWQETLPLFVKIMPIEYRSALVRMKQYESKGTEEITITEEVYR